MMKTTIVGKRYELQVGESSLILNADGTIILNGIKILINGKEHTEIKGEKVDIN